MPESCNSGSSHFWELPLFRARALEGDILAKYYIREYRQQNDWFHNFIDDRCEIGGNYAERSQTMYLNYRAYCDEVGDHKRSAAEFKNEMLKAGYKWHKTKTGASYYGIRLASEFLLESFEIQPPCGTG